MPKRVISAVPGWRKIAEPIEDQRCAVHLHPLGHMGMVTDDQVDALLARGKPSPVFQLLLIRHDAPFEPVMDGEDAVVGPKLHEAVHHELEIFRIAVRRLSGLVLAGAMLLTPVSYTHLTLPTK